jgi:Polyketide cyclase / dehydrase and lipid transport
MAHYQTTIASPLSPEEAFAQMADVARFAEWDPGVLKGKQVIGNGPSAGSAYDLTIDATPQQVFRYRVKEFEPPKRYRMIAKTLVFTSIDEIRVSPNAEGSLVSYAAELKLNGPLGVFDLGLRMVFGRIGDKAAAGLAKFLRGKVVHGEGP